MKPDHSILSHVRDIRRNQSGYTQQDLADAIDVTRQTIVAIEKGNYNPSIGIVLKLSRVLETSVEELFELKEE